MPFVSLLQIIVVNFIIVYVGYEAFGDLHTIH